VIRLYGKFTQNLRAIKDIVLAAETFVKGFSPKEVCVLGKKEK